MPSKTLRFQNPIKMQSRWPNYEWEFPFAMIDTLLIGAPEEESETSHHRLFVGATEELVLSWRMTPHREDPLLRDDYDKLMLVPFEHGLRFLSQKLASGDGIPPKPVLALTTENSKLQLPYDPAKIKHPNGLVLEFRYDIPALAKKDSVRPSISKDLIDLHRIEELHTLSSANFELSRLIRLCEELNICFEHGCYHAVAFLTRALIDYVPPIFDYRTFGEVANNYGGKSLKSAFRQLDTQSRDIADLHLHSVIQKKEILPTSTQVDFGNSLDLLIGEIIRILK